MCQDPSHNKTKSIYVISYHIYVCVSGHRIAFILGQRKQLLRVCQLDHLIYSNPNPFVLDLLLLIQFQKPSTIFLMSYVSPTCICTHQRVLYINFYAIKIIKTRVCVVFFLYHSQPHCTLKKYIHHFFLFNRCERIFVCPRKCKLVLILLLLQIHV